MIPYSVYAVVMPIAIVLAFYAIIRTGYIQAMVASEGERVDSEWKYHPEDFD